MAGNGEGIQMAKGRKARTGQTEPEAPAAEPREAGARSKKDSARLARRLRQHMKRLGQQLAAAAKTEARRVRKLERARWRRQLLEAALDEARSVSAAASGESAAPEVQPAAKAEATTAPKAKATTAPKAKAKPAPKAAPPADMPKAEAQPAPKPKGKAAPEPKGKAAPKAKAKPAPKAAPPADVAPADVATGVVPGTDEAKVVEAYCLREKKRVQMLDPKPVVTASGGSALSGTCSSCGAALFKLVSRVAH